MLSEGLNGWRGRMLAMVRTALIATSSLGQCLRQSLLPADLGNAHGNLWGWRDSGECGSHNAESGRRIRELSEAP